MAEAEKEFPFIGVKVRLTVWIVRNRKIKIVPQLLNPQEKTPATQADLTGKLLRRAGSLVFDEVVHLLYPVYEADDGHGGFFERYVRVRNRSGIKVSK